MVEEYKTTSTSATSAKVKRRIISETSTTRKILEAQIVENPNNPKAGIKISIINQKKSKKEQWEALPYEPGRDRSGC